MAHTVMMIVLFFVIFLLPCVAASSIDLDEEEAMAEYRERFASSQREIALLKHRNRSSS